jgi:hypothetical protein
MMNSSIKLPKKMILEHVPKVTKWSQITGIDITMPYSIPAVIADVVCCIDALEKNDHCNPSLNKITDLFQDLMHVTGIGYGYLWIENNDMINELWRVNDLKVIMARSMKYCRRKYYWLLSGQNSPDEMKTAVMESINKGRPVIMEFAGMLPEFSIVTGYDEHGDVLIGWTYCEEQVDKRTNTGMFMKKHNWTDDIARKQNKYKILVIGEKNNSSISDREMFKYAVETMDRRTSQDFGYAEYAAGMEAYRKWLKYIKSGHFNNKLFMHYIDLNTWYPKKCIQSYYKKLHKKYFDVPDVKDEISHILNLIEKIIYERDSLCKQNTNGLTEDNRQIWYEYALQMFYTQIQIRNAVEKLTKIDAVS